MSWGHVLTHGGERRCGWHYCVAHASLLHTLSRCYTIAYIALAPGYRPGVPRPMGWPIMVALGGAIAPPRPPRPRPRPRPRPLPMPPMPGIAKSGFAMLASRITSSGLMGGRSRPPYGANWPAGAPISGCQAGLMGRCEMLVKCDTSEAAGLREPSGRSSYDDVRGRFGSLILSWGGARRWTGLEPV